MLDAILLGQVNVAGLKILNWGGATECVKLPFTAFKKQDQVDKFKATTRNSSESEAT